MVPVSETHTIITILRHGESLHKYGEHLSKLPGHEMVMRGHTSVDAS